MFRLLRRGVMAAAVLALALPVASQAGTLQVFESTGGVGSVAHFVGAQTGTAMQLDFDGSTAEGGHFYGLTLTLISTGDVVLDSFTCNATAGCLGWLGLPGTSVLGSAGDGIGGEFGVGALGLLTFSGSNGTIEVQAGGAYLDGSFLDQSFNNIVVADVTPGAVPEPGTLLLLGASLAGMAFLRRRQSD